MASPTDGGFVFPQDQETWDRHTEITSIRREGGMTRRQLYAGMAMVALVSGGPFVDLTGISSSSWELADALLEAESRMEEKGEKS